MIYAIEPHQYGAHSDLLDQMFRLRARSFHERRHWRVAVVDGREVDMFDDLGPVYVISVTPERRVVGSLRLLPTTGPHMLADVFSDLMDGDPIVRHPLIWESSRFNVDTDAIDVVSENGLNRATGEVLSGLIEVANRVGLSTVISVYDLAVERILRRAGCSVERIGSPKRFDGLATVAGLLDVGDEIIARMHARAGFSQSVLSPQSRAALRRVA